MKKLVFIIIILAISIFSVFKFSATTSQNASSNVVIPTPTLNHQQEIENPTIEQLLANAAEELRQKKYPLAAKSYVEAFKLDKKSNLALIGLSQIYYEIDNTNLAFKNLENAKKLGGLPYSGLILELKLLLIKQNITQSVKIYEAIKENTNEKLLLGALINIFTNKTEDAKIKLSAITAEYLELKEQLLSAIKLYSTFKDGPIGYLFALTGQALINNNQIQLSRPFLFASIEKNNDYRDAWFLLGYSYLLTNKNQDAVKALNRAKQIDPYNTDIQSYLKLAQQDNKLSFLQYGKASLFSGNTNNAENGNRLFVEKKYSEALLEYKQAIQNNKLKLEEYIRAVYIALEINKNPTDGLNISLAALTNYPETPMSFNLIGWSYLHLKNYKKSIEFLKKAINLDPNLDAAYLNLGILAKETNDTENSFKLLNKAIELAIQNRNKSIEEKAKSEIINLTNQL